jgi:hypothetical protein
MINSTGGKKRPIVVGVQNWLFKCDEIATIRNTVGDGNVVGVQNFEPLQHLIGHF